ncbi:MAG: DoxX family protein [Armatimonas sp.]
MALNPGVSPPEYRDRPVVDQALLVARIVVGIIFMAHGAQKLFGAFGGPGIEKVVEGMGPIGYLVSIGEFFGGLGLVVGFLSLLCCLADRYHAGRDYESPPEGRVLRSCRVRVQPGADWTVGSYFDCRTG